MNNLGARILINFTHRSPPSDKLCTAASRKRVGDPYGSKSITLNRFSSDIDVYINIFASAKCGTTKWSTLLFFTFSVIDSTALIDKSLATIVLIPGTSFAYLMLRRPVADSASRILRPV